MLHIIHPQKHTCGGMNTRAGQATTLNKSTAQRMKKYVSSDLPRHLPGQGVHSWVGDGMADTDSERQVSANDHRIIILQCHAIGGHGQGRGRSDVVDLQ